MLVSTNRPEELLDLCLLKIQREGRTIEECLDDDPKRLAPLEPLLQTATRINSAPVVLPSSEFQAAAVQRMRRMVTTVPQRRATTWSSGLFPNSEGREGKRVSLRLVPLLAGCFLALLILAWIGADYASAHALPGDFLYPVKRAQEQIQLALMIDESGQADLNLQFSSRRIEEAVTSIEQNRLDACDQALASYQDQIQTELDYLSEESHLTPDKRAALASQVIQNINRDESRLAVLFQSAPQASQPIIEKALSISQKSRKWLVERFNNLPSSNQVIPPLVPTLTPGLVPVISSSAPVTSDPKTPAATPTTPSNIRPTVVNNLPTSTPTSLKTLPSSDTTLPTPTKPPAIVAPTAGSTFPSTTNSTTTAPPNIATAPIQPNNRQTPTIKIKP